MFEDKERFQCTPYLNFSSDKSYSPMPENYDANNRAGVHKKQWGMKKTALSTLEDRIEAPFKSQCT